MSKRSRSSDKYEVGYGKPPARTRFPKGRSGNPKGTPKGGWKKAPSLLARIDKALGQTATVRTGEGVAQMDVLDAGLLAIAAKVARGDLKAMQFLHELRREAQALEPPPAEAEIGADDQAILDAYLARLQSNDSVAEPAPAAEPGQEGPAADTAQAPAAPADGTQEG
jgi:hypothetical protein